MYPLRRSVVKTKCIQLMISIGVCSIIDLFRKYLLSFYKVSGLILIARDTKGIRHILVQFCRMDKQIHKNHSTM